MSEASTQSASVITPDMAATHAANISRPTVNGHERNDSGEYFTAYSHAYRPNSAMTSRASRAPSAASSAATFKTAHTPSHSMESSKQTPKMWARPPTPPHHDEQSDAAPSNTKRESFYGTDTESFYSHLRSRNLSRTNSLYSISRVSFNNQIKQLTSIQLPDANSLSSSISAIQTAPKASRALNDAAAQIQAWINKASEVLDGLHARDDIDWAAQAGREGLEEVDGAIDKFDSLVNVYVTAVERLEMREDAGDIPAEDLQHSIKELEKIITEWKKIKSDLKTVKHQVELSLEWEELRNSAFDDAAQECEDLSRQVFEMEEHRHVAAPVMPQELPTDVGLDEFEGMILDSGNEGTAQQRLPHRYSLPKQPQPASSSCPPDSPNPDEGGQDSNLMGLFAQMQALRASLDFLPMRIQQFQSKASEDFPTACRELEDRKDQLEEQWQKLETDAQSLRKELSEDRWLLLFRNAGRQALKMIDSVDRSRVRLDEALDVNTQLRHAPSTMEKLKNYETKKLHYRPAIEKVIALVDRGVRDRLTLNGEIIRLQNDVKKKWQTVVMGIRLLDGTLNDYHATETQQLRESVSSVMTNDHSLLASSVIGSMGSSPASSVGPSSRAVSRTRPSHHASPSDEGRPRQTSVSSSTSTKPVVPVTPAMKRYSSLPIPMTPVSSRRSQHQTTPLSHSSLAEASQSIASSRLATPRTPMSTRPSSRLSSTPSSSTIPARPTSRLSQTPSSSSKPRWNVSTSMNKSAIGHNFRPLSATEPSPYSRRVTPVKYTPPGAARRIASLSPMTPASTTHSRQTSATSSIVGSPSPQLQPGSAPRLRRPSSLVLSQSSVDLPTSPGSELEPESPTSTATQPNTRPPSSLTSRNITPAVGPAAPRQTNQSKPRAASGAAAQTLHNKPRITSAGVLNTAQGKTPGTSPKSNLNRKRSDLTGTSKR